MPRDLYLTALMREVMKACYSAVVMVGTPHFMPMQRYWEPPPYGVNFTQATKIPK